MAEERKLQQVEQSVKSGHARVHKLEKKEERAQAEGAIDYETRKELAKAVRAKEVSSIDGCVSTGKEANVYAAGSTAVVKVLRTSSLAYKGRADLVQGDRRFAGGFAWHSPKQVARTWALKEFRNLRRLYKRGINCPMPLFLRKHIIGMSLISPGEQPSIADAARGALQVHESDSQSDDDGALDTQQQQEQETDSDRESALFGGDTDDEDLPPPWMNSRNAHNTAPLLRDAASWLSATEMNELLYSELLPQIRTMYQQARLVHGDLSEYNILVADRSLVILDVAQAVDVDHPLAHELLQRDLAACLSFFAKHHTACPSLRASFAYIIDEHPSMRDAVCEGALRELRSNAENGEAEVHGETAHQGGDTQRDWEALKDAVFMRCRVPRSLLDIDDYETEFATVNEYAGAGSSVASAAANVAGEGHGSAVYATLATSHHRPKGSEESDCDAQSSPSVSDDAKERGLESEDANADAITVSVTASGRASVDISKMTKEEAKEHKRAVKQQRRERRQHKVPKHEKKRRERSGQRKKQRK